MSADKDVVKFQEVGRGDIPLVGGKGTNLGEMLRANIPVPPGFIKVKVGVTVPVQNMVQGKHQTTRAHLRPCPVGGNQRTRQPVAKMRPSPMPKGETRERPLCFISYEHRDAPAARLMARYLAAEGVEPWLDDSRIPAGGSIVGAIQGALARCDAFLVIISHAALNSTWVTDEIQDALWVKATKGDLLVIPALLEDCDLPPLLRGIKHVRLNILPNGEIDRTGLAELTRAVKGAMSDERP